MLSPDPEVPMTGVSIRRTGKTAILVVEDSRTSEVTKIGKVESPGKPMRRIRRKGGMPPRKVPKANPKKNPMALQNHTPTKKRARQVKAR